MRKRHSLKARPGAAGGFGRDQSVSPNQRTVVRGVSFRKPGRPLIRRRRARTIAGREVTSLPWYPDLTARRNERRDPRRARPLRAAARRDPRASPDVRLRAPADRPGADPGRIDRGNGRADQHHGPGGKGRVLAALAHPSELRDQGVRPGGAGAIRDHARQDHAGGVRHAAGPRGWGPPGFAGSG